MATQGALSSFGAGYTHRYDDLAYVKLDSISCLTRDGLISHRAKIIRDL